MPDRTVTTTRRTGGGGAAPRAPRRSGAGARRTGPAPRFPDPGGFTLVEVLVALTLGALVATAVVAGVRALVAWTADARSTARAANRAGALRGQVVDWLAGATVAREDAGSGIRFRNGVTKAGADDDELVWTTLAASPFNAGQSRVRFFVDRDSTTEERGLVAELSGPGDLSPRRVELAPEAEGMDVRFRIGSAGGAWMSSWGSSTQLPAAVEMRLAGDALPRLLRAPIVVSWSGP